MLLELLAESARIAGLLPQDAPGQDEFDPTLLSGETPGAGGGGTGERLGGLVQDDRRDPVTSCRCRENFDGQRGQRRFRRGPDP